MTMYMFGYGSLIFSPGINGRGMDHTYTENDLTVTSLKGYQRCWNTEWDDILYLGLIKSDCHFVNGVIFPVDPEDAQPLLDSEGIYDSPPMYTLEDVTELIDKPSIIKSEDRIFTCVTENPTAKGKIKPYYINIIRSGLITRGKKFKHEFIETTFPNMPEGYYNHDYKS